MHEEIMMTMVDPDSTSYIDPEYEQRQRVRAALVVASWAEDVDDLREMLDTLGLRKQLSGLWRMYLDDTRLTPEERLRKLLGPLDTWSMNTIKTSLPDLTSREVQTIIGRWRLGGSIEIVGTETSMDPRARGRKISTYKWKGR